MNRALKFRIYPTTEQKELLTKTFGCCRLMYNKFLAQSRQEYETEHLPFSYSRCAHEMKELKKEMTFLREVDSIALQQSLRHLQRAYENFFAQEGRGFPRFKSRHASMQSYTTVYVNNNIRLEGNTLRLPKIGKVKVRRHRDTPAGWKLKSVTVSMESTGTYFASILYEYEQPENQRHNIDKDSAKILGIDFAMHGLAVFSDGNRADYPMYYRHAQERLAREQRKLSHCVPGSKNYGKQKKRIARRHEKIRNQRKDFLHKLSRRIADSFDAAAMEDIDMKAMSQGMHFGKSVMDNGNGVFRNMLRYKLEEQGKELIVVDRFYPSSKRCSVCGNVKTELRLSERIYRCSCGNCMDRDVNAAVNIREEGRRILAA